MRGYECYYYFKGADRSSSSKIASNGRTACWAGVPRKKGLELYVSKRDKSVDLRYIKRLIELLNKITPTSIVLKKDIDIKEYIVDDEFIKIQLPSSSYTKNLYILEFIRMIWYDYHKKFKYKLFFKGICGEIDIECPHSDPLEILTFWAIYAMDNSGKSKNTFTGDHSLLIDEDFSNYGYKKDGSYGKLSTSHHKTAIRSSKEFNNWDGQCRMDLFATGREINNEA